MDKYKMAFKSGVLAGVILDITDYVSFFTQKIYQVKHILYADYMVAALIQGKPSKNVFEFVCGQIFHLMFTGCIGCLYILGLTIIHEKNSVFRGWLVAGIGTWFILFMIGILYKIDLFMKAQMNTVLSDFITSSIFGISLAILYRYFEHRYKLVD